MSVNPAAADTRRLPSLPIAGASAATPGPAPGPGPEPSAAADGDLDGVVEGVVGGEVPVAELDFVSVYRERYVPMVRVAVLLLGDRQLAEEVVQDAFVAAYPRWSQVESPAAYVRQCVVNKSRDVLRRRRLAETVLRRSSPPDDLGLAGIPEHVADLLDVLTPRQRTAVVLRYYEDLGLYEIARLMHTRPGTVGSLLNRALARLREDVHP